MSSSRDSQEKSFSQFFSKLDWKLSAELMLLSSILYWKNPKSIARLEGNLLS